MSLKRAHFSSIFSGEFSHLTFGYSNSRKTVLSIVIAVLFASIIQAQLPGGVYVSKPEGDLNLVHELKVAGTYLVHTVYQTNPPDFIRTYGGFYARAGDSIQLALEFSSSFENDSLRIMSIPVLMKPGVLIWGADSLALYAQPVMQQPLDGAWLFATRGPDNGQDRRGEDTSRKTLKFLIDGHFQWIAYDTDTMHFSGTGGGKYEAKDGNYIENIGYFSRDNERVGARLEFNYELQGADWHHTGLNSRGEPMYEIWARREKM